MKKIILLLAAALILTACGENKECFSEIAVRMGYIDTEEIPCETEKIVIPQEFNAVYEKYNELQKQGGFDLTPYKGRECTRYTYNIPSENARLNVLVCDGEIIGGDICGITLDSIMLPLDKRCIRK